MSNEKIKVVVFKVPLKDLCELKKYFHNVEVVLMFVENLENRFNIRVKLEEILFNYLSEIELFLPLPAQIKLFQKLMEVFGFSLLYFYIYIIISIIYTIICLIDSVNDYDLKRNTEIMKCYANLENGILGMKRDVNLQLLEFFHSYDDVRAVLIC
jgi:hypothetical protein